VVTAGGKVNGKCKLSDKATLVKTNDQTAPFGPRDAMKFQRKD